MDNDCRASTPPSKPRWRRWIRRAFVLWAIISTTYIAYGFRTVDVPSKLLQDSPTVSVDESGRMLGFLPCDYTTGVIFFCGSGVSAEAYVPLLHPLVDRGVAVFIIQLPYRFAPLASHRERAIEDALQILAREERVERWVISGHSLGGALAAELARKHAELISALVLVGTSHPRDYDLSWLTVPVTKVHASNDGFASLARVDANRYRLPPHTQWVLIEGGNHCQFGNYAYQFLDGEATISRDEQQRMTRDAIDEVICRLGPGGVPPSFTD